MSKPRLKLVRCYRGDAAHEIKLLVNRRISKGPLKGCRNVLGHGLFRFTTWAALQFKVVIRVNP